MKTFYQLLFFAANIVHLSNAFAAVSAEEAKQLGGSVLTALGSEKEGNKEGTIPAYTPQVIPFPASYDPKLPGTQPDPWNEKPLYSITAQNASKYADKLDQLTEVFKKYPNFRMDVYPTHRVALFPKYVIDNTIKNATVCKMTDTSITGCYAGFPFPIPKNGTEVMWNHLVRYSGYSYGADNDSTHVIPTTGEAVLQSTFDYTAEQPVYAPGRTTPMRPEEIFLKVRLNDLAPPRKAGGKLILIDPIDPIKVGRRAYQYIPGQRRVKLAPDLAYDTPSPYSGGTQTMDDAAVFYGALDRFDWKLIGKKEKFLPANMFKSTDYRVCPDSLALKTKNFPNPDCYRWELRRVWVVEATLKKGYRHIYKRRMFYWDEDSYAAGIQESFDAGGSLYRISLGKYYPYYQGGGNSDGVDVLDLQTGIWSSQSSYGAPNAAFYPRPKTQPDTYYSPEAMAGEGIR